MHGVHLLGFSTIERATLANCLRLAAQRLPAYAEADSIADAEFVVADADSPDAVAAVLDAGRLFDAVFVGRRAPVGAAVWMARPLDPLLLLRELDAIVAMRAAADAPAAIAATPVAGDAWPAEALAPPAEAGAQALIVDDSEVAQRFLALRLRRLGIPSVAVATSGEALEQLGRQRFEFVFVDVELGDASDLDGLALCREVKRGGAAGDAVVVVVSAYRGEVDRVRGTLAGADAYLGKPLDDVELARLVARPPRPPARAAEPRRRRG